MAGTTASAGGAGATGWLGSAGSAGSGVAGPTRSRYPAAGANTPVLGTSWISTIPTSPATIQTYLGLGVTPALIPFLGGEILIGLNPSSFLSSAPSPGMHSIFLPISTALCGVTLTTQGLRVDTAPGGLKLTLFNGQILTL